LCEGRKNFLKGWRGRSGPQQRPRTRIVLGDNLVASPYMI
jgi:hypothetical protein